MSNYLSKNEINEIGEGLIETYSRKYPNKANHYIDIDHFITQFLQLEIEYTNFAESDAGKIGFLADGETALLIHKDGKILPYVYPKNTVVVDKFLLQDRELGRRRFTLAHEASHYILGKLQLSQEKAFFHSEFDGERIYTKDELYSMMNSAEWQADVMAASLLMPKLLVRKALLEHSVLKPFKLYGTTIISAKDKHVISVIAKKLGVSYSAFVIRLKELNMFEYRDISEYISGELNIGGA